jgi:SAM-dependent methyltransferase
MPINKDFKLGGCLQKQVADWFETRLGQALLAQEQACLEQMAASVFGYHAVQIGVTSPHFELLRQSPARNRILLDSGSWQPAVHIRADPRFLPLASDSIDGVMLPHTLDFSPDPHQLVREVERILIPEGKVVLSGFNPWSLWGVSRLFHRRWGRMPWCGHFFSPKRVQDWFSLLGFDLEEMVYLHYRPPMHNQMLMQKLHFMERVGRRAWPMLGGVYVMQAVKRTATMTPIRVKKWRVKKRVLPTAAEPTARVLSDNHDAIR